MGTSPLNSGSRARHRVTQILYALGIALVVASTVTLFLAQPPTGSIAAAEETVPVPTSTPTTYATPTQTPTPDPTFPPDQVDDSWPKNPPWDACPAPVWPGTPSQGAPGDGRRVLVLGDSLTRESQEAMTGFLEETGWTPTFRCWGSKRLDWGLDQIKRAKQLDQLPEHVVIALGTNDISWEQPATTEQRVNTLLDRLGPNRQVLWVDLDIAYSSFSMQRAHWFNGMIRQVAKKRENVTVVPWERIARQEKVTRFDGIHYGQDGYRLRARALTDALNESARQIDPGTSARPEPLSTPTP